jgi:hypothetical protein
MSSKFTFGTNLSGERQAPDVKTSDYDMQNFLITAGYISDVNFAGRRTPPTVF